MALFFKKGDSEFDEAYRKLTDAYRNYRESWQINQEESMEYAKEFMKILSDLPMDKVNKRMKKESKKDGIVGYNHPVFGWSSNMNRFIQDIEDSVNEKIKRWNYIYGKAMQFKEELDQVPMAEIRVEKGKKLKRQKLIDIPEIKPKNITRKFNKDNLPAFVVIDVETTGVKASSDRIIQLSAILFEDFEPVEVFDTLINPQREIPEDATRINGITDKMVADAPTFPEVADSFVEFIRDLPIVGYNVPFDLKFLFCSGIDAISKKKIYDVFNLAKKTCKGETADFKLLTIANHYGIFYHSHDSKEDCFATAKLFEKTLDEILG